MFWTKSEPSVPKPRFVAMVLNEVGGCNLTEEQVERLMRADMIKTGTVMRAILMSEDALSHEESDGKWELPSTKRHPVPKPDAVAES